MMSGRPLKFRGRLLGDYVGEEEVGPHSFVYTDFNPAPGVKLDAGDLEINFETGQYTVWENWDLPDLLDTGDIYTLTNDLPRLHGA